MTSSPGYAFAFFRSHCLDAEEPSGGGWHAPDCWGYGLESKWRLCECEEGYFVCDHYHWHSSDGKCHNAVKCR